jgi:hypothetical protein
MSLGISSAGFHLKSVRRFKKPELFEHLVKILAEVIAPGKGLKEATERNPKLATAARASGELDIGNLVLLNPVENGLRADVQEFGGIGSTEQTGE